MTNERGSWRAVFLTYPCESCGAKPGEECVTSTGKVYRDVHADRARRGDRCPRCHTVIEHDVEPGSLCGKCSLLRSLEIERATKYRRAPL